MNCTRLILVLGLLISVLCGSLAGQTSQPRPGTDPCAMPVFSRIVNDKNIFNDQQEEWLGEILDQGFKKEFHVVEDPDGRLQQLGERLLAQLPPTRMHYKFVIVDSPELNSFGFAGGRIYIFRRLISFAQNEDELAALLGHEIGHIVTHQIAIDITRLFADLGITQVGDKQDILAKWNQLQDNSAKIHEHGGRDREEKAQQIADRMALYAMTRAGYDPASAVSFFDRLFLTKGNQGGFWSDFFGHTRPESARLREIVHNAAPLPPQCVAPRPETAKTFQQWQQQIIGGRRAIAKEELPGLVAKTALQPSLRNTLEEALFSPDGKYIAAQDESSIFVLTREPLANLFRIDAPDAYAPQFSPDSRSVVFYDRELRVQKWDIETRQRTSIHELNVTRCWGSGLAPTGDVLACARPRLEIQDPIFELDLFDVATGKPIFTRDNFYQLSYFELFVLNRLMTAEQEGHGEFNPVNPSLFNVRFSPDGRYVVVARGTTAFVYDLANRSEIKMPYGFKDAISTSFTFVAPDQIAGFNRSTGKVSRLSFPEGHVKEEFALAKRPVTLTAGDGNLVVAHSGQALPAGILDLAEKKIVLGFKAPAFDVHGAFFAGEENTGQIVLGRRGEQNAVAKIILPFSPLGNVRAAVFSADGKWLAVSGHSLGSVWNLESGKQVFATTNFDGALFDESGLLFMKFPKRDKNPSQVYQFDLSSKTTTMLYALGESAHEDDTDADLAEKQAKHPRPVIQQAGDLLFIVTPKSEQWYNRDYLLEVRETRTNKLLWDRKFQGEQPHLSYQPGNKTMAVIFGKLGNMRDAVKDNATLRAELESLDAKKDAYVIQVLEASTGKPQGAVLVDTGKLSFLVQHLVCAEDVVAVGDSLNRTLVFSLKSGEKKGELIGQLRAVAQKGEKILVERADGVAEIYETATLHSVSQLRFPSTIVRASFAADGTSLLILTADQQVYKVSASDANKVAATQ